MFGIESIHHRALTRYNTRHNAVMCNCDALLWYPALPDYPYNRIDA